MKAGTHRTISIGNKVFLRMFIRPRCRGMNGVTRHCRYNKGAVKPLMVNDNNSSNSPMKAAHNVLTGRGKWYRRKYLYREVLQSVQKGVTAGVQQVVS